MVPVGRDAELEILRGLLLPRPPGEPAELPAAAIVEGAPGMGKTTVLRWTVEAARGGRHRCPTGRGDLRGGSGLAATVRDVTLDASASEPMAAGSGVAEPPAPRPTAW